MPLIIIQHCIAMAMSGIGTEMILCTAGLSPDLQSMEQIRQIMRPMDVPDQGEKGAELGTTCV